MEPRFTKGQGTGKICLLKQGSFSYCLIHVFYYCWSKKKTVPCYRGSTVIYIFGIICWNKNLPASKFIIGPFWSQWMESSRKVAGLSIIRVKQNINALWKLAESCQITKFVYPVIRKDFRKSSQIWLFIGVVLDENFSWKDHIEYVSSKVSRRLGLWSRIRSCLTLEVSKQIYTSLLKPSFDYADVAWGKISEGYCKEFPCLQDCAAQIILQKNTSNDTFCVLNWLNLASRRKMHKCILVFKCLNNLVPKYLYKECRFAWSCN